MSKAIRLYVDMDGVLAVFNPVTKVEELYEEGYFKNLPSMKNMIKAVENLVPSKDIDVYILSAVLDSPFAKKEKNEWLDKNLPMVDKEHRVFCEYGTEKSLYIVNPRDTDVLIDDYTKNLKEWHGVGIKVLNGINDTNKTWKGDRVSSCLEANILSYTIKNLILKNISKQKSVLEEIETAKDTFKHMEQKPKSKEKDVKKYER